jgi:hypothetical protein
MHAANMPNSQRLGALYFVKNEKSGAEWRRDSGPARSPAIKEWHGGVSAWFRMAKMAIANP